MKSYVRDPNTNAILNTDDDSVREYKKFRNQTQKIHELEKEVNEIRDDLKDIKNMLQLIFHKV